MNDIIINIYNNFVNNKLKIELLNENYLHDKLFIFNKLLEYCNNHIIGHNNYKKLYSYSLYNYIIFNINYIINECNDDDELNYFIKKLILKLIKSFKGHLLLNKLNLNKYFENNYEIFNNYLMVAAYNGNIHTFDFFYNKVNFHSLSILFKEDILFKSINNLDDRIFKNILEYFNVNKLLNNNNILIHQIINKISKKNSNKIKILLKYISIEKYYSKLVISFKNIDILKNLNKHYNLTYSFNLLKIIYENYDLWNIKYYNEIKSIIKSNKEHVILNIIDNIINLNPHYDLIINTENIHHVINNSNNILLLILDYYNIFTHNKNNVINILISNNLINNFIYEHFKVISSLNNFFKFFLYTKCFDVTKIPIQFNYKITLLNKFLHRLRLKLKYKYNNKIIFNINLKNKLFNEILTFKSNNNFNVLKKGSVYYQNIINYNNFYSNYKNNNICFLPINIFPKSNLLFDNPVIAKYIKKYDLYIIYDIYIPNISNNEKNNLLLQLHPKFYDISNLKSFLMENNMPKWFPKLKNI